MVKHQNSLLPLVSKVEDLRPFKEMVADCFRHEWFEPKGQTRRKIFVPCGDFQYETYRWFIDAEGNAFWSRRDVALMTASLVSGFQENLIVTDQTFQTAYRMPNVVYSEYNEFVDFCDTYLPGWCLFVFSVERGWLAYIDEDCFTSICFTREDNFSKDCIGVIRTLVKSISKSSSLPVETIDDPSVTSIMNKLFAG